MVTKKEFVVFTKENSYKAYHDDSLYKLDPDTGTLTITKKLHLNKHSNSVKKRAPYLINKVGERILGIIRDVGFTVTFLTLIGVPFYFPLEIFENSSFWYWNILLSLSLAAFVIGIGFYCYSVVEYYNNSKCSACKKDYACEEFKEPQEIEISTIDSSDKTEYHYWKCNFCGYEDIRTKSHSSCCKKDWPNKSRKSCQKCGGENTIEEYRPPYMKTKNYDDITIRYYRCKHCDYNAIEIEIEEGYID